MKIIRSIIFCSALITIGISFTLPAAAGDPRFPTTAEGIIDGLTKPQTQDDSKMRAKAPPTRQIYISTQERGVIYVKQITVSDDQRYPRVNMKIEFDVNSYTIRPQSYKLINELGRALLDPRLKNMSVVINGHTDSDGDPVYNLELSLRRAISVKSYLSEHFSIPSSRLKVVGFGEALPLVSNNSWENKQINRRVEIARDEEY